MLHLSAMSIDTYGLSSEQYEEFFEDNIRFSSQLYVKTCNIMSAEGAKNVDFKTILDLYQEAVYAANDDCRRYQKTNNPEALKDADLLGIYPSIEEMLEEIKSVSAKVEALADYVTELIKVTTKGLEGVAESLVD
jgi:hypothetical protein